MKNRLVKILRKAQPSKALNLHECIVQYEEIPNKVIAQIAKKTCRVKYLSLPDYTISQELLEKYSLWLKYARRLKRLDYIAPSFSDFPDGEKGKYKSILNKFFHEVRRDRLDSLNISQKINDENLGSSFLKFQKYPSTLKSFAFDCRNSIDDLDFSVEKLAGSLKHMKELKSVSFALYNQSQLVEPILSSIANPNKIENLSIEFIYNGDENTELSMSTFSRFVNLANLRMKLDFCPKNLNSILKSFTVLPLKNLHLDVLIEEESHLIALKELITRLRNLESLTLKISKNSEFKNENTLNGVFEKISHIRPLKNLKLHFITPPESDKHNLDTRFLSSLRGVFTKAIKLERFSLRLNQVEPRKAFTEVLNHIEKVAPSLKKLEVNVGEVKLNDDEYLRVTNLLQRMSSIQVLKLNSLNVTMSQYLEDLMDVVYGIRGLTAFEVREMTCSLNKAPFISIIEKLLSKRGLSKFDCGLSWVHQNSGARRTRGNQIDLKRIIEVNPQLKKYPQSAALYVYYDNDTEWRWA